MRTAQISLLAAGICMIVVVLLHAACIIFGAEWYLFLGAGEQMASLAAAGDPYPAKVTAVIIAVFIVWTLYAFAGAGMIKKLPLLKWVLLLIGMALMARGTLFFLIMPAFPTNSMLFWFVSSVICIGLGSLYLFGVYKQWRQL